MPSALPFGSHYVSGRCGAHLASAAARGKAARRALACALMTTALLAPFEAFSQGYPVRPLRIIVGFSAGGGIDVPLRVVAKKLSENVGQPVVIENLPGAAGLLAMQKVASATANGYTLLGMSSNDTTLPALNPKAGVDLKRDFAPVALTGLGPMVLVIRANMPERSVKELIATAQGRELTFGSSGTGGTVHLTGALFSSMTKARLLHVPFKGSADTVIAMAGDQVDMSFPAVSSATPMINAGKLKPLAVTTLTRTSALPAVPTLDESGLRGFERTFWVGLTVPAGVPKDVIARLSSEVGQIVELPEIKEALRKFGLEPRPNTPEQFTTFVRGELDQNAKLLEFTKMKAE